MKGAEEEKASTLLQSARMDFAIFFDIFSCDANDSLSIFQLLLKIENK